MKAAYHFIGDLFWLAVFTVIATIVVIVTIRNSSLDRDPNNEQDYLA